MTVQTIRSFIFGFFVAGVLFVFAPAIASVTQVEKQISKFVGSFKCRTVDVQDIDLWGGRVLVTAQELGISFVMIAKDSATYDICPVGVGVTTFQALDKKKK
tara:strand:+ start:139 stop:444 length:306 start_codon:yes stop_codon:yes gene_type:complete